MPEFLNSVHFRGRVDSGKDGAGPVFSDHGEDKRRCSWSIELLSKRNYKTWVRCVGWNDVAAAMEDVRPGDWIEVWGEWKTRSWQSPSGKQYITEANITQVEYILSGEAGEGGAGGAGGGVGPAGESVAGPRPFGAPLASAREEEIPF